MASSIRFMKIHSNVLQRSILCPISSYLYNGSMFSTSQSPVNVYNEKNPAYLFFDEKVQTVLRDLTGFDLKKIFHKRYLEHKKRDAEYKFLTEEDLKKCMDESKYEARRLLQMPPVVKERLPIEDVISEDPEIQGRETSQFVFTDITYGVSDRKRLIVVREPDGTLRHAPWELRHRMNQMYNPKPRRFLSDPEVFEEKNFKALLLREEYIFILDFACAHYEPDDPKFQNITIQTYEHVKKRENYDVLYSTRHYGPMCFYLAWNKKIDSLLIKYIHSENLDEAAKLIQLLHLIHPDSKSASCVIDSDDKINFIKEYANLDSEQKPNLLLCIQSYEDLVTEKMRQMQAIKAARGV